MFLVEVYNSSQLPAYFVWHTSFILFMEVLISYRHKETLKSFLFFLPFFDICLSIFCHVIWQVDLWLRLIFSRR